MRTDFTLDDKAVRLPNTSSLGFGKVICKRGNYLVWKTDHGPRYGRSVGHIVADGKHFIYAICLLSDLTHLGVAFVDPKDVTYCVPVERGPKQAMESLFNTDFSDLNNIKMMLKTQWYESISLGNKESRA